MSTTTQNSEIVTQPTERLVTLSVPASRHRQLKIAAAKLQRPMSELIAEAIDAQLPKWNETSEAA